jgi:pimeloyl-ACP methyl ester carboxylesterase
MAIVSLSDRVLERPDAGIAYDVREPSPPSTHPALLMIGQPMTAQGFDALAAEIPERTVVTYDPRGLGRSTRSDGSSANDPKLQAEDLYA